MVSRKGLFVNRHRLVEKAMIAVACVLLATCGANPISVPVSVNVTNPSSSTIWQHYQSEASIQWNGGSTDNVSIRLMKGGEILELLASSAPNSGTYVLTESVSPSWGTGTDYTIRIEDGLGQVGLSQAFEIAVSEGAEIIQVSQPSSGTVWSHYQTDVGVSWSYPAGKAGASHLPLTGREGGAVLSGDEVDIELYQGANKVATLASGIPANAGNYNYPNPVPPAWGTGTDYRIRVVDDLGNFGYSGSFSIEEPSGQELINVTVPNSSTVWEYQQTGTTVQWEYPRPASLSAENCGQHRYGDVRIEMWKDGVKVGDYCGWVPNTGSYTRSESLPSAWGAGYNYQIKVVDSNNNYGMSNTFMLAGSLLEGLVAYWPLNGNANDESGNSHHGSISGAIGCEDRFGTPESAFLFDGSDDYMEVQDFRDWSTSITLACWTKYQGHTSANAPLFDKHGEFNLVFSEGKLSFYLAGVAYQQPSYTPPIGQWIHVAATWNGSTMAAYINGVCIGTKSATGTIENSEYSLYIASDRTAIPHYYKGAMDDVRIYNRALTSNEVFQLYQERAL